MIDHSGNIIYYFLPILQVQYEYIPTPTHTSMHTVPRKKLRQNLREITFPGLVFDWMSSLLSFGLRSSAVPYMYGSIEHKESLPNQVRRRERRHHLIQFIRPLSYTVLVLYY